MDFDSFFTPRARNFKLNKVREACGMAQQYPGMISMGGGIPNPEMIPLKEMTLQLVDGSQVYIDKQYMHKISSYPGGEGYRDLVDWVQEFHLNYHKPPFVRNGAAKFGAMATTGAQGALDLIFRAILDVEDTVIIPNIVYPPALHMLRYIGCDICAVDMDEHGLIPRELRKKLQDCLDAGKNPKCIYTVPTGHNPTGATVPLERKKEIYKIAREFNLIIVADDPYYFLQFSEQLVASYQSIDEDGRVLRIDSTSKILAAGLRVGWISGAYPFVRKLLIIHATLTLSSCHFSQSMTRGIFDLWGAEGFFKHIAKIQSFYKNKRDLAQRAATKWLTGICEWNCPTAGIYLWIRVKNLKDSSFLFESRTFEKGVLVVPGFTFSPTDEQSSCFRISYSLVTDKMLDEGMKRLSEAIKDEMVRIGVKQIPTNKIVNGDLADQTSFT